MAARPGILLILSAALGLTASGLSLTREPIVKITPFKSELSLLCYGGQMILGRLEEPDLPNLYRHDERLFSGGLPKGKRAFERLAEMGVRTVISVDGAEPDVAAAATAGLRYVHLPIGYEGIPRSRLVELYAAMHDLPGPVYIHCHRGLHRGPAAAVAVCQMEGSYSTGDEVGARLKELGTAAKYSGLYRDAREAKPPTVAEQQSVNAGELPPRTPVPPLTQQMVELDHAWDRWGKMSDQAVDWDPPLQTEATHMAEILTEAGRTLESHTARAVLRTKLFDDGRWLTNTAERKEILPAELTKQIRLRCDRCHAEFRDHQ